MDIDVKLALLNNVKIVAGITLRDNLVFALVYDNIARRHGSLDGHSP